MTDDRKLLEAAAKAAGVALLDWRELWADYIGPAWRTTDRNLWNPLADDGDALGLAVKLRAIVDLDSCSLGVEVLCRGADFYESFADHLNDEMAATRRAIVRAAAEIGSKP